MTREEEKKLWDGPLQDLDDISNAASNTLRVTLEKRNKLLAQIAPCTSCGRKVSVPCDGYFAEGRWDVFCEDYKK